MFASVQTCMLACFTTLNSFHSFWVDMEIVIDNECVEISLERVRSYFSEVCNLIHYHYLQTLQTQIKFGV